MRTKKSLQLGVPERTVSCSLSFYEEKLSPNIIPKKKELHNYHFSYLLFRGVPKHISKSNEKLPSPKNKFDLLLSKGIYKIH